MIIAPKILAYHRKDLVFFRKRESPKLATSTAVVCYPEKLNKDGSKPLIPIFGGITIHYNIRYISADPGL